MHLLGVDHKFGNILDRPEAPFIEVPDHHADVLT